MGFTIGWNITPKKMEGNTPETKPASFTPENWVRDWNTMKQIPFCGRFAISSGNVIVSFEKTILGCPSGT